MIWRKVSEKQIGGNYTWWDADFDSVDLLPLLYCIGNAIPYQPLDYYLQGIFTDQGPCGGDPGWGIEKKITTDGKKVYWAYSNAEISGLDPCEGDYDEETVKKHVRRTLENFRKSHPERSREVDEVVAKYQL